MNNKTKIIIVSMTILLVISLFGNFTMFNALNNKEVEKSVLKNAKTYNNVAIMYETEAGSGEYTAVEDTNWPTSGYNFNTTLSKCENGSSLTWDDTNKKVVVTANISDKCYVYFDVPQDVQIAVSTGGVAGTVPPSASYLGYRKAVDCTGASWSDRYNRLEISSISGNISCNLTYTNNTSTKTTLKSKVESVAVNEGTAGHRYEGTNPDNYVWFNNEMWRIIGSIPTCTTASCGTTGSNLVKIIRKDAIGALAYDGKSSGYTGTWGSNTLYHLLNEYYYGKQNGTNGTYCYGYNATAKAKCDYREIGISGSDYYGSMVEEVYWNTGASSNSVTASAAYTNELATQTIKGHVGLMTASDYGYATSASHDTTMDSYNNATHTLGNWLYNTGNEWTSVQDSSRTDHALYVTNNGYVKNYLAYDGYAVRPVLYLDASVYIVGGTGTEADPYIIAM